MYRRIYTLIFTSIHMYLSLSIYIYNTYIVYTYTMCIYNYVYINYIYISYIYIYIIIYIYISYIYIYTDIIYISYIYIYIIVLSYFDICIYVVLYGYIFGLHMMLFCPQDSWQSLLLQPLPQLRRAAACAGVAAAAGETTGNRAEILGDTWHNLEPPKQW